MTRFKYFSVILSLGIIISCDNSVSGDSEYQEDHKKAVALAYKAISDGDTLSYDKAAKWFILSKEPNELFFYSNTMALRYNYCMAYYHNYFITNYIQNITKFPCDSASFYYMLYNISKTYELGCGENNLEICGVKVSENNVELPRYYYNKISEKCR